MVTAGMANASELAAISAQNRLIDPPCGNHLHRRLAAAVGNCRRIASCREEARCRPLGLGHVRLSVLAGQHAHELAGVRLCDGLAAALPPALVEGEDDALADVAAFKLAV